MGVPEAEAHLYSEGVRRGGILAVVQTDPEHTPQVVQSLRETNAIDIDTLEDALQEEGTYFGERERATTMEQAGL
jgi:hypothetical protein